MLWVRRHLTLCGLVFHEVSMGQGIVCVCWEGYFWWWTCARCDWYGVSHSSDHHVHGIRCMQTCGYRGGSFVKLVHEMFLLCCSMVARAGPSAGLKFVVSHLITCSLHQCSTTPLTSQQFSFRARQAQQHVPRACSSDFWACGAATL